MLETEIKAGAVVVVAAVIGAVLLKKKIDSAGGVSGFVSGAVQDGIGVAVDTVGGAVAGVGYGLGDIAGVPRTDMSACEQAIADGRTWDASFACPAGRYIEYLTTGK